MSSSDPEANNLFCFHDNHNNHNSKLPCKQVQDQHHTVGIQYPETRIQDDVNNAKCYDSEQ